MGILAALPLALLMSLMLPLAAAAQEPAWSFGGSVGIANLSMREVRQNNEDIVADYNEQGIPLPLFTPLNPAPFLSARAAYRWGPFGAVAVSLVTFTRSVETAFDGPSATLELTRTIGATDIMLGVLHYFPRPFDRLDLVLEIHAGYTLAWARVNSYGVTTIKAGADTVTVVFADSHAEYSLRRPFAAAGLVASLALAGPLVLKAEGRLKSGPIEQMEGKFTVEGVTETITSEVNFDYSGLYLGLGLALEF